MEKLTADAIVAGGRNVSRQSEDMCRLIQYLLREIYRTYPGLEERDQWVGQIGGRYPVRIRGLRRELEIHNAGGVTSSHAAWDISGKPTLMPSVLALNTLWPLRDELVSIMVETFPLIREQLEFFAACAPK